MTARCVTRRYSPILSYPLCPSVPYRSIPSPFRSFMNSEIIGCINWQSLDPCISRYPVLLIIIIFNRMLLTFTHALFIFIPSFFSLRNYFRIQFVIIDFLITGNNRHRFGEGCDADAARKIRGCILYLHQWQHSKVLARNVMFSKRSLCERSESHDLTCAATHCSFARNALDVYDTVLTFRFPLFSK